MDLFLVYDMTVAQLILIIFGLPVDTCKYIQS